MIDSSGTLRIATYNIHKCRGIDRKVSPARIIAVIRELRADVVCLQEVVNAPEISSTAERIPQVPRLLDQAGEIARALPEYAWAFGDNRPFYTGTYGNMTLSRFPLRGWRNHDLSRRRRERRGVLETEIEMANGRTAHIFNVHLGTGHMERRYQARKLIGPQILTRSEFKGPRLVIGDFNEWTRGLTTRLLRESFNTFRPRHVARFPRTYPGLLPILTLDHCYYELPLVLEENKLWYTRTALVASDHLPLVATFCLSERAA